MLIGNLPIETTEDELLAFFSTAGTVSRVEVLKDKNGRGRGFAFVTMATKMQTQHASMKLNNSEFKGRLLCVSPVCAAKKDKKENRIFGFCW